MEDEMRNFYKAAGRIGMDQGIPPDMKAQIRMEIDQEDDSAPFPPSAAMTPRSTTPRVRETGAPRDLIPMKPDDFNMQTSRRILHESEAHKYFSPTQIERLKYQRLQEIAENDRKKVINVLHPVISLLNDIKLTGEDDSLAVQEVKDRLCAIAQGQTPIIKQQQPTPRGRLEKRLRFAEAIKPIQSYSGETSTETFEDSTSDFLSSKWYGFFSSVGCCGTTKMRRKEPAPVDLNHIPINRQQPPNPIDMPRSYSCQPDGRTSFYQEGTISKEQSKILGEMISGPPQEIGNYVIPRGNYVIPRGNYVIPRGGSCVTHRIQI